jgi:prepilin-type N-terminal cleavage/methylation domain-containing protein
MKFLTSRARTDRRKAGFSLVEIMIAVAIIGLLVMLAYPALNKIQRSARNARFISDVRVFSQSFESYSMETGLWPPNAGSGVVPVNMANNVRKTNWVAPTSVGGQWNWDAGAIASSFGFFAGISVVNSTASDAQMALIDRRIDDGDLNTGLFRKVTSNRFSYILQEL